MKELRDLSKLSHEQKDALIHSMFELIQKLTARVEALELRLSQDSHNSSKPPSSDAPWQKTRSLRRSSGKAAGGQAGQARHAGHQSPRHPASAHGRLGARLLALVLGSGFHGTTLSISRPFLPYLFAGDMSRHGQ